jgi:CRP-like cAMP-binding protein
MNHSHWVKRMKALSELDAQDVALLGKLSENVRVHDTHDSVVKAGDPVDQMFVVLDGLICEYRLLPDGRRQILAYLLPGDMTDPRQLLMPRWDHALCALWPARIAVIGASGVQEMQGRPGIMRAASRYALLKQAIAREWLVNVGNRSAFERASHLLCELHLRLKVVGLASDGLFALPLTQSDLADTLALSAVHVNRTLMELRRSGLLTMQSRQVTIHDLEGLMVAAGFREAYLQLACLPTTTSRGGDSGHSN